MLKVKLDDRLRYFKACVDKNGELHLNIAGLREKIVTRKCIQIKLRRRSVLPNNFYIELPNGFGVV